MSDLTTPSPGEERGLAVDEALAQELVERARTEESSWSARGRRRPPRDPQVIYSTNAIESLHARLPRALPLGAPATGPA